jgi:FKBP-type peptidyl-prolyl cis-trans isomerase
VPHVSTTNFEKKTFVTHLKRSIKNFKEKMTDLSGDGGVMKKIIKEGEGECPPKGNQVVAHYTGTSSLSNRDFRRLFQ